MVRVEPEAKVARGQVIPNHFDARRLWPKRNKNKGEKVHHARNLKVFV